MFSGLMPAMVTPFDDRGEVDLGTTEVVVELWWNAIERLGWTASPL
jgi:dihydrodipicolinate synthase/N-acetylneuraminate lyase